MILNILKILMNLHNNTALNLIYNQKILYTFYIDLYSIFLHHLVLACYICHTGHWETIFSSSPKIPYSGDCYSGISAQTLQYSFIQLLK